MRVAWITDYQAPYRDPIWSALAEQVDLTVCFLADASPSHGWKYDRERSYASALLPTVTLPGQTPDRALFVLTGRLPEAIRSADVLIFNGWISPAYVQMLVLAKIRRQRVVIFWASTLLTNAFGGNHPIARFRRLMLRAADAVLTVGTASAEAAAANGVNPGKIVKGFNTVDNSRLRDEVLRSRATLDPDMSGHHYLFVGQLIERKQATLTISAFAQIAEPSDVLDIVGDGPEFSALARQRELSAVTGRIRLRGDIRGVALSRIYAQSQTLVLPSHTEVWGLVANEALACGLHVVVSSRAGCAPDLEGMQGVFICEPTLDGLSRAMVASRGAWEGYIREPDILSYSSATQAAEALQACRLATELT